MNSGEFCMIEPERIMNLNEQPERKGRFVLYWMQASQREQYNHALEYAIERANELDLPTVVLFVLVDDYPEANVRHYTFMLQGLVETQRALAARGIKLVVRRGQPATVLSEVAKNASLVVTDRGYLKIQLNWRHDVADAIGCRLVQVESDVVMPIEEVSDKEEYAARTIRPRIHRLWYSFLKPIRRTAPAYSSLAMRIAGEKLDDIPGLVSKLKLDTGVAPVSTFHGGASHAEKLWQSFLGSKLADYAKRRNDPSLDIQSHMSPYLHFGQVSALKLALDVCDADEVEQASRDAFLEELIVRRELSMNFVYYNPRYDSFEGLPAWTRKTLESHSRDKRPRKYSLEQLEQAQTDDPYWNAAQREMVLSGKMHNYMRMYWGKKIIEWSDSPRHAFEWMLYLNNRYELDGRDPNSFTGVAWCFGKHDRPWKERPVFGTVRYMSFDGLKRKFDMDGYLAKVDSLGKA